MAFDVPMDTNDTKGDMIFMWFDEDYDGQWESDSSEGYFIMGNRPGDSPDTFLFHPIVPNHQSVDTTYIVESTEHGFKKNKGHQQAELRLPFGDECLWYLNVELNDSIGIGVFYQNEGDSVYNPYFDYWFRRVIGKWPINYGAVPDINHLGTLYLDTTTVGIETAGMQRTLPTRISLSQNFPNPFNPTTQINYALPQDAKVRLDIYNLLGQKVATLVDRKQQAGYHSVRWDASSFASGVYFYRLQAGDFVETKRMILLK